MWGILRTLSFGLFGFSAFIWPLVLIYVAVMATLDKTDQKIGVKIFEAVNADNTFIRCYTYFRLSRGC